MLVRVVGEKLRAVEVNGSARGHFQEVQSPDCPTPEPES